MTFTVLIDKNICGRGIDRAGCCFYLCDDRDIDLCGKCFICYNVCPYDVFDIREGRPYPTKDDLCVGCRICIEMCPNGAIKIFSTEKEFLIRGIGAKEIIKDIRNKALTGKYAVRGCGTIRPLPTFDDLIIVPAQLAKSPVDKYREEVKTEVVLGERFAKKPLKLSIPVMFGAMSYGAVSKKVKKIVALASSVIGIPTNTGEGGTFPEERKLAKQLVVQWASGRFGVSASYLKTADAIEVKIGQGAKPGMGGLLLAEKITPEISQIRGIPVGTDAVSPARFLDAVDQKDLAKQIEMLREVTENRIPIIVKLGAGDVTKDVEIAAKAGTDIIAIDGMMGGTAAGPEIAIENTGLPTLAALVEAVRSLKKIGLKNEIDLVILGGIRSGADVAKAIALGANAVGISTPAMIALGCKMCRACHKGICPYGIATQDPRLTRKIDIKRGTQQVVNYLRALTEELEILTALSGHSSVKELDKEDLRALDPTTAQIAGVKLIGH